MAALIVVAGIWASVEHWDWLRIKTPPTAPDAGIPTVSNGETLRNVALLIGGALALVFGVWRGWLAERQASTAQRQAETAQKSLLNDRYERGADMLGSPVLEVRLAGIYALDRLAAEHPNQYHLPIMKLFCAFVVQASRERPIDKPLPPKSWMDTEAIMEAIRNREQKGIRLEWFTGVRLELNGVYLRGIDLRTADLRNAELSDADLMDVNLSSTLLDGANLSGTWLGGAVLFGASMYNTNLSGAMLVHGAPNSMDEGEVVRAAGLTQADLDRACADPDRPPILEGGVFDDDCRELEWHGGSCKDY